MSISGRVWAWNTILKGYAVRHMHGVSYSWAGIVGFPLPGIDVIDADPATGEPLQRGEVGAIEVWRPNVFRGYLRMPEKTKEDLLENGFRITGDLGKIDNQGYTSIVGCSKGLIFSSGYNVYP